MNDFENRLLNTPLKDIFLKTKLFDELLPFDEYHLVMAQTDVLLNIHNKKAVKSYFYRTAPFGSSYIITAGLTAFLSKVENFSYRQIISYLENKGYKKEYIDYLKTRDKIAVKIYSLPENTVAFPNEPIIILETNLHDARILEGILLSEMNFASLVATKWHRIRNAACVCPIMEFGRRRAQNSLKASLYSYIAGINGTSNCEVNNIFGIPSSGTMGHEFIQSFSSEYDAFDKWLEINPDKPVLLIDTINTLESGLKNAVKAFLKHKNQMVLSNNWGRIGVRIDSGDLAYLAVQAYEQLSEQLETENVTIVLSNDLEENSIQDIFTQFNQAGKGHITKHISFGIGTKGATAWGDPALGGVCKISELENNYILKISNHNEKTTIPGNLRSAFVKDKNGEYITSLIYFHNEDYKKTGRFLHIFDDSKYMVNSPSFTIGEPRQSLVYVSDGNVSSFEGKYSSQSLLEIRQNSKQDLECLDWSYKRIVKPHRAKVSLSEKVFNVKKYMTLNMLLQMDKDREV